MRFESIQGQDRHGNICAEKSGFPAQASIGETQMKRCPECNCWGGLHSSGCPETPGDDDDTTDASDSNEPNEPNEPDDLGRAEYYREKKIDDARGGQE
jgi:hypothetical protein